MRIEQSVRRAWEWVRGWWPWTAALEQLDVGRGLDELDDQTVAFDIDVPPAPTEGEAPAPDEMPSAGDTAPPALERQPIVLPPVTTRHARLPLQEPPLVGAPLTWHLRSTILDRLDEYFVCMQRLQRHDPDSYQLFSRIGFSVAPDWYINGFNEEQRARLRGVERVAFGGILWSGAIATPPPNDAAIYPSFMYFQKMRQPSRVQVASGGVIYRLTAIYDDRHRHAHWCSRYTEPVECHVLLEADGRVRLLKERVPVTTTFETRPHRKHARKQQVRLTQTQWQVPSWLSLCLSPGRGVDEVASYLFTSTLLTHLDATKQILIRVTKGPTVATFGIALPRAKYFFADRALDLAVDGKRKRIFHAVAGHTRTLATQQTTAVREHYRGVRHFDWKGYRLAIVLPAHQVITRFDGEGVELEDVAPAEQATLIGTRETGDRLAKVLSS